MGGSRSGWPRKEGIEMNMIPRTMAAVRLMGHGGLDKLVYSRDVAVPAPADGEVLIRVTACGI